MPVKQHYFTSWYNRRLGNGGFQTKAASPDLSPDLVAQAEVLGQYQILLGMRKVPYQQHPAALRYRYLSPTSCILLCSQSNGKDESVDGGEGRDGNYFIHSLFTSPDEFMRVPPIFYWHSPFWVMRDASENETLPDLPSMASVPWKFDMNALWTFLAADKRREWLYTLLCAVIHREQTSRPIILVDATDNIAMWIAAVSCALPPYHKSLLSFTTYYHAPQSKFAITGVFPGTNLRYPDEFETYFILDATHQQISAAPQSDFARIAVDAMTPDRYETSLLAIHEIAASRFGHQRPTQIDDSLDQIVKYADAVTLERTTKRNPVEIAGMRTVLEDFGHITSFTDADKSELLKLHRAFVQAIQRGELSGDFNEYTYALRLFRGAGMLDIALVGNDLLMITDLLAAGQTHTGERLLDILIETAGEPAVRQACNSAVYLEHSARRCMRSNPAQLGVLWNHLWRFITPDKRSLGVIVPMIKAAFPRERTPESEELRRFMLGQMQGNKAEWLRMAVEQHDDLSDFTLDVFYYYLVRNIADLDQRLPYRASMQKVREHIALTEFSWDMERQGGDVSLVMICLIAWIKHAEQQHLNREELLERAIQRATAKPYWNEFAVRVLIASDLAPFVPDQWKELLLQAALATVSLQQSTQPQAILYQKYMDNTRLVPPEKRLVMKGVFAMFEGHLDHDDAKALREHFTALDPKQYQTEAGTWLDRFFQAGITRETHGEMVVALYTAKYAKIFWPVYWRQFGKQLNDAKYSEQLVDILSFWFDDSLTLLGEYQYAVQEFFLGLPLIIELARKEKGFREVGRRIHEIAYANKISWYNVLHELLQTEKKGFLGAILGGR